LVPPDLTAGPGLVDLDCFCRAFGKDVASYVATGSRRYWSPKPFAAAPGRCLLLL